MDITTLGIASVAAITIICYGIGVLIKASPLDSKYIPPVMALAGAVLGVAGMALMPDYPGLGLPDSRRCGHRERSGGHWRQSGGQAADWRQGGLRP